jgi:hypothetical protein
VGRLNCPLTFIYQLTRAIPEQQLMIGTHAAEYSNPISFAFENIGFMSCFCTGCKLGAESL